MQHDMAPIATIVTSGEHVSPGMRVKQVAERFFQEKHLDALALVEEDMPMGLVTRNKLLFTLFRRFGFELYERKPILDIADKNPLIIRQGERVETAIDKALARPFDNIYDDIVVIDDDGRFVGLLSVKRMIIEQSNALANSIVQKELATEKAKELEKINKVKSQFIANVTHELRAPVNAIIGLAEMMKISCEKGYIEQVGDRLSLLFSSAVSLRAIITNILDLSKVEAGKMEVICEDFDLAPLLDEVVETTRILVGKKPVKVDVSVQDTHLPINTDRVKLRQILINLTSNAAKFTDSGMITLGAKRAGDRIEVYVSDTGIGIREEDLERLFLAFTQVEDARTKRYEGTGLGLTITKHLAGLLGGDISVQSSFKKGSLFMVSLPDNKQQAEVR
ncbi:MAG: ATP-binding protein [Nitrospirota bacterium]